MTYLIAGLFVLIGTLILTFKESWWQPDPEWWAEVQFKKAKRQALQMAIAMGCSVRQSVDSLVAAFKAFSWSSRKASDATDALVYALYNLREEDRWDIS